MSSGQSAMGTAVPSQRQAHILIAAEGGEEAGDLILLGDDSYLAGYAEFQTHQMHGHRRLGHGLDPGIFCDRAKIQGCGVINNYLKCSFISGITVRFGPEYAINRGIYSLAKNLSGNKDFHKVYKSFGLIEFKGIICSIWR